MRRSLRDSIVGFSLLGGILMPGDGSADPSGVTQLLAKAARKEGVGGELMAMVW